MNSRHTSRMPRFALCLAAVALLFATASPVSARTCGGDLVDCYYRAASIDNWWARFMAGLDCELSFADCAFEASVF